MKKSKDYMAKKNKVDELKLKATPEKEDFRGKYESGLIGKVLLDRYFSAIKDLVNLANIKTTNARAIEVGCGEGLSTQRLNSLLPKNVTLEASEYVEHQISDAKENNPEMKITQESIYQLTHEDDIFDVIFLPEVLEHLDFPKKGLLELRRVTKNKGYLIIGVPNEPLWRVLNMARGKYWKHWGNTPGHLNHWSTKGIVEYVEKYYGPVIARRLPLPWTILLAQKRD